MVLVDFFLFIIWFPPAVPVPPHSVMAIRDTDTSVLVQWQEPKDKNGILGYYLYYSEAGKHNWKTVNNKPFAKNRYVGKMLVWIKLSYSDSQNDLIS